MSSLVTDGAAEALRSLAELARRAGYRLERARTAGLWLLVDTDGELVRTPRGDKAWSAEAAQRRLQSIVPPALVA